MNYLVEDWGGKYQSQEISAKKGINLDKLLDKVLLEAEFLDLKANPNRKAQGVVIESTLDKGRGYVATVLVQNGTLRVGDVMLSGVYTGKVKAMFNERGTRVTEAPPSTPVLVLGLNGAAHHLTMHIVRKLAHFCEYMLEGFLLMLCLRVYTRHLLRHVSWPILGGLLTALTDETVQLFVPGRSGQVTDIWIDFSGVMTGLMVGLILLGLIRMCILLYKHRNED